MDSTSTTKTCLQALPKPERVAKKNAQDKVKRETSEQEKKAKEAEEELRRRDRLLAVVATSVESAAATAMAKFSLK